ncbi:MULTISPECIES: anthranilate synthase component I [Methanosphaera]|uniref:anthranilate synthase n=1 Tax=Methanosphaera stadtmanae (strain ATCC 43021 / DSM 3091 / JCM 11832 / MCB-3) TaxID=339860 RepID=Q2NFF0_METST|nr:MULTISPECIES: anthranilate synthase component I [Methanosphaera]ABC57453.1 TrpE [Methanosphaera stadtmanae DSM 3091]OEC85353.1 anthranilate synthase [Methanosphaera sp. A6]
MNVFGDLKKLIKKPTTKKIEIDNPVKLFKNLYYNYKDTFLLESMESDSGLARYSIIGFNPVAKIKAHDHNVTITTDTYTFEYTSDNPLLDIKTLIKNDFKEEGFRGGLLGYVSYESIKYFENVPTHKSIYPDFEFGLFLDCIVYDNIHKTCEYTTLNEDRSDLIKRIYQEEHTNGILEYKLIQEDFTQDEYENAVDETKNLITDGEIFQAVISNSENLVLKGSKLPLYEHLRKINPSHYMYHIKLDQREIIGSSPEMLMRLEKGTVESYPIAGTRPRGKNKQEDEELEKSLLNDEKELAEHLMLVDLARNDIGKISKSNTVKLEEFYGIRKFSHVQHIVSHVTGKLNDNLDAIDAFMSLFPAGTLSGAPKIRAMEIINQKEKYARGPYGGAVGYFSLNGNADFAITIRTLTTNDNRAEIQAGAGIVYDSIPQSEYEECRRKRQALFQALKESGSEI